MWELLKAAGLATSNTEARKLIQQGGARVNDAVVTDEKAVVGLSAVAAGGGIKVSAGKKRHVLVKPT